MNDLNIRELLKEQDIEIRRLRIAVTVLEHQIKKLLKRQINMDERARFTNSRVQIIETKIRS